ncbi:AAA family ATPase [Roseimaritima ulvae]|uniref:Aerobic cobaltochelatase subunit CobS n=1 Tax=Roseimaritima ulvae TaxID=980254 RepID=A0A5B9R2D1_9BACT|nr:AAA family ATPase [Roseimaritima ulvae]QEG40411.1 Aerobic cobaltochelatase subunit CobS [Roseimaritima ulvae]
MSDIMLPTNPENVNETEVLCQGRRPGDTGYGTSRYRAKCPACKKMIEQGDKIEIYSRPGKRNRWKHADCTSAGKPNQPTTPSPATPAASDVSSQLIADLVKRITELENRPAAESIEIRQPDDRLIRIEGKTHSVFPRVLQLAAARKPVFLPGPSGCGKSHLGGQVAEALELRFASISCSAGMSEAQLLGRLVPRGENGQFQFVGTEFLDCFENGGVFLFDEIDAADPNVLLVINAALANGFVTVANRPENPTAKRHPDFVCIAAANTFGRGADRLYVGRNELDDATLDRFRIGTVPMEYDADVEAALCPDDSLRNRLLMYRERVIESRLERTISSRFMRDAYEMKTLYDWSLDDIDNQLFAGWSDDERQRITG